MFSALHSDIAEGTGAGTGIGGGGESSLDLLISASFPSVPLSDFSVRRKPAESNERSNHFHGILLQNFGENLIDSARYENPYNYESQIEKENDENELYNEDEEAAIEARLINKTKIDIKIKEKKLYYEGENEAKNEVENEAKNEVESEVENEGDDEVENEVETEGDRDLEFSSESLASDIATGGAKKGPETKAAAAAAVAVEKGGDKGKEAEGDGEEKQEIDLESSMDKEDGDGA
jgi:hypothetical protein